MNHGINIFLLRIELESQSHLPKMRHNQGFIMNPSFPFWYKSIKNLPCWTNKFLSTISCRTTIWSISNTLRKSILSACFFEKRNSQIGKPFFNPPIIIITIAWSSLMRRPFERNQIICPIFSCFLQISMISIRLKSLLNYKFIMPSKPSLPYLIKINIRHILIRNLYKSLSKRNLNKSSSFLSNSILYFSIQNLILITKRTHCSSMHCCCKFLQIILLLRRRHWCKFFFYSSNKLICSITIRWNVERKK